MLRAAMEVFFARRAAIGRQEYADINDLIAAYDKAQQYRDNIAHGIAVGFRLPEGTLSGYFLCPPSYASRKVKKLDPREVYLLGAAYWYRATDIDHYTRRFTDLLGEAMKLIQAVNKKYAVLEDSQLHP